MQKARKSDRTRAAILAAAQRLFAQHGHGRTTVRDIAAKASIDPALVVRYFGSKDELFVRLEEFAQLRGYHHIIYGVNKDDLGDYRPGQRAAKIHQVKAPLVEVFVTVELWLSVETRFFPVNNGKFYRATGW